MAGIEKPLMPFTRPCLLLDVDGVLNPDLRDTWNTEAGQKFREAGWVIVVGGDGQPVMFNERPIWLNPGHGPKLRAVAERAGADLAWATRWHHLANQMLSPFYGLPQLPVIPFPPDQQKVPAALPWIAWRPFVWLDDEDEVVAACEHVPHGAAVRVDPAVGLTDADLEWAAVLLAGGVPCASPVAVLSQRTTTAIPAT